MPSSNSLGEGFTETDRLRRDNEALKRLISRLSEASLHINANLDPTAVLQAVVVHACELTGARYGALLTYDRTGGIQDFITTGMDPNQRELMDTLPKGLGVLGYLNEVEGPVRLSDIATHPSSVGLPPNHPPMKTFLGISVRHQGNHLGNIYLTEKEGGEDFSPDDEEIITLFAAQAATAISNARRHGEELRISSDLLAFVEIAPVGVTVIDAKTGDILAMNEEAKRIFGDLPNQDWEEVVPTFTFRRPDGREIPVADLPIVRVLTTGETVRADEVVISRADGIDITALVNAVPIYSAHGDIDSVMSTLQDMSPLQEIERLRAEFLGMVSHELRAPLTTIKGSTTSLLHLVNPVNDAEAHQLVRIIDQQSDQMRSQINSLIELTHIEAGTLSVSSEPAVMRDLIDEAIREFGRPHPEVTVVPEFPIDLPRVTADKQRIGQVLQYLLSHATRYSSAVTPIRISASTEDVYVKVAISVDNRGIEPTAPPALFTRIMRFENPDQAGTTGSDGLALTICKGIVEAHGGRVAAERGEHGRGVTFSFTIPIADEEPGAVEPSLATPLPPRREPVQGEGVPVLVAVDDPRMIGSIRRVLTRSDYTPITTFDLTEMDQLMEDENPHAVLLDLSFPSTEHLNLVHSLSSDYGVPVIVLSGQGDDESIAQAFEMGADDYIVKPFSPTELTARIKASLRKQGASLRTNTPASYILGHVNIDYAGRLVTVHDGQVHLTATEYNLLYELSTRAGRILTQDELLQRVWGPEYLGQPQLLRAFVKTLRQKLGDDARRPMYIFTEHGIGYRMAKP